MILLQWRDAQTSGECFRCTWREAKTFKQFKTKDMGTAEGR